MRQTRDGEALFGTDYEAMAINSFTNATAVRSGCTASRGGTDTVDVAAGEIITGGTLVSVFSQSVSLPARGSDTRYDAIVIEPSAGNAEVVQGSPNTAPNIADDRALVAIVRVPPSGSGVSIDVLDARMLNSTFHASGVLANTITGKASGGSSSAEWNSMTTPNKLTVPVRSSDPSSPEIGQFWINSTDNAFRIYTESNGITTIPWFDPGNVTNPIIRVADASGTIKAFEAKQIGDSPAFPYFRFETETNDTMALHDTAGAPVSLQTEDFEDDAVGTVPEGWVDWGRGDSTATSDPYTVETVDTNVISGIRSVRVDEPGAAGTSMAGFPNVDSANIIAEISSSLNSVAGGNAFAGVDFYGSNGQRLEVRLSTDDDGLYYSNDAESVSRTQVASNVRTGNDTLEVRNASSGIDIYVNGTLEYSTSDTFNGNRLALLAEDSDVVFDDVQIDTSESLPPSAGYHIGSENPWRWWVVSPSWPNDTGRVNDWANGVMLESNTVSRSAVSGFTEGYGLDFPGDDVIEYASGNYSQTPDAAVSHAATVELDTLGGKLFNAAKHDGNTQLFRCGITSGGGLEMFIADNDSTFASAESSETPLTTSSKHRVAFTKPAGVNPADMKFYVDGSQLTTNTTNDQNPSNWSEYDRTVIGAYISIGDGSENTFLDGRADNIRLENRELSATEISDDYNKQPWS